MCLLAFCCDSLLLLFSKIVSVECLFILSAGNVFFPDILGRLEDIKNAFAGFALLLPFANFANV